MTALQALVALALFAPGVLAPKLGLSEGAIGAFATAVFAVGTATSLYGGILATRFGAFAVAAGCAACVMLAMLVASGASLPLLIAAGLLLGLAFGPETPTSSSLLSQLARPEQRPLVFSVRQTGNQIGAIAGSLMLPVIAMVSASLGFLAIAVLALVAIAVFLRLRTVYDGSSRAAVAPVSLRAAWRLVTTSPPLVRIALASMPFSAMQMALNTFFVSHATSGLARTHVTAGVLLGLAQGAGLAGRLGWGVVATWTGSARAVLVGLGVSMGGFAVSLSLVGPPSSDGVLAVIVMGLGLTASGWNGVLLAEVARLAPEGRVAEATGAVLMASYTGLLVGPALVAGLAAIGTLALSYGALGMLCAAAALLLSGRGR